MSTRTHNGPRPSASTRAAAQACLARMAARRSGAAHQARESPAAMARGLARALLADAGDASHLSLIKGPGADDVPDAGLAAAWPLRFGGAEPGHEKPLLYFLRASAASALRAACWETQDRGIILNLAETTPSRWTKGVMPDVPVWLNAYLPCTPYDPASADEARAILRGALHALYVDGDAGCCYLTLHGDDAGADPLSEPDAQAAWRGMYRIGPASADARIRLCGAGKALSRVIQAAGWLRRDWGIDSEIWSCPSYTRLARDAGAADRWNGLNPLMTPRTSHLDACLNGDARPVLAVTDYHQPIAGQIGAHVRAPFVAVGADSQAREHARPADAQWLVAMALRMLG